MRLLTTVFRDSRQQLPHQPVTVLTDHIFHFDETQLPGPSEFFVESLSVSP